MTPAEIQALRAARGWTQAEAAAACGVNIRTWQRWEEGTQKLSRQSERMLLGFRAEAASK